MLDPAAEVLRWAYDLWPSYGGAILLVAVAVGLLSAPQTIRLARAARTMAILQPEVERIRARYGYDPARANAEVDRLYRENNAASTSGCVLIIVGLAIPVLLLMVVNGLTAGEYVDPGSDLARSVRDDGGQLPWFGLDLGQSAFLATRGPEGWTGALGYLVLPSLVVGVWEWRRRRTSIDGGLGWVLAITLLVLLVVPAGVVLYLAATGTVGIVVATVATRPQPACPANDPHGSRLPRWVHHLGVSSSWACWANGALLWKRSQVCDRGRAVRHTAASHG